MSIEIDGTEYPIQYEIAQDRSPGERYFRRERKHDKIKHKLATKDINLSEEIMETMKHKSPREQRRMAVSAQTVDLVEGHSCLLPKQDCARDIAWDTAWEVSKELPELSAYEVAPDDSLEIDWDHSTQKQQNAVVAAPSEDVGVGKPIRLTSFDEFGKNTHYVYHLGYAPKPPGHESYCPEETYVTLSLIHI